MFKAALAQPLALPSPVLCCPADSCQTADASRASFRGSWVRTLPTNTGRYRRASSRRRTRSAGRARSPTATSTRSSATSSADRGPCGVREGTRLLLPLQAPASPVRGRRDVAVGSSRAHSCASPHCPCPAVAAPWRVAAMDAWDALQTSDGGSGKWLLAFTKPCPKCKRCSA